MEARTVAEVEGWESRPFSGGYDGLHDLADGGFSGAVVVGDSYLFMIAGRVVGVFDYHESAMGDVSVEPAPIDRFEDAGGTAYTAPHDALSLLYAMAATGGETRGRYYSQKTPIEEVDETLREGGFSGYLELSENVLSGDYYLVYHRGRRRAVAYVGQSRRLKTDDEAYDLAREEVGLYEVNAVRLSVTEIPGEPNPTGTSVSGVGTAPTGLPDVDDGDGGEDVGAVGTTTDADAEPDGDDSEDAGAVPSGAVAEVDDPDDGPADDGHIDTGTADGDTEGDASGDGRTSRGTEIDLEAALNPRSRSRGTRTVEDDAADETPEDETPEDDPTQVDGDGGTASGVSPTDPFGEPVSDDDPASRKESATDPGEADEETTPFGERAGEETGGDGTDDGESSEEGSDQPSTLEAAISDTEEGSDEDDSEGTTGPATQTRPEPSAEPGEPADRSRSTASDAGVAEPAEPAEPTEAAEPAGPPDTADPEAERTGEATQEDIEAATAAAEATLESAESTGTAAEEQLEAQVVPSIDPDRTARASRSTEREPDDGRLVDGETVAGLRSELSARESRIEELRTRLERVVTERDELRGRIEDLERRLTESGVAPPESRRELSPAEALGGTSVLVSYVSRTEPTLADAHDGLADREGLAANLLLETHTTFETEGLSVSGLTFDRFFEGTQGHRFVQWLLESFIYEVRETENVDALGPLYDALPALHRVEFDATVTLDGHDRETTRFDLVGRDDRGNPLFVAHLEDDRAPTTAETVAEFLTDATAAAESHESLVAAFAVTASYFEEAARETVEGATGRSLLSRSKRRSFVSTSRKGGYHLCLVRDRGDSFYLAVPEL